MSKEDWIFAVCLVSVLVLFFGGMTVMALSADENEWIPDGNCYIHDHSNNHLFAPDVRTVKTYCEVER